MRAFDDAVRRYGIEWTMLSPAQGKLIRNMESSGEWRRVYGDEVGVIDVRQRRAIDIQSSASSGSTASARQ
jgi:hypothetical protein